jgi:DNA-directed RNA polymerase beta' subunit
VPPRVDDVQSSSVPPIAVRPPGKTGPGQRRDDDLTHKLNDIVKHNKVLKSKLSGESKADVIEQLVILLQLDVLSTSTTPRLV